MIHRMAHLLACVIEHVVNRIDSDRLVERHGSVRITFAEELELLRHAISSAYVRTKILYFARYFTPTY